MIKRVIKVGLDFDGVVAYNPFRIVRPIVAFLKRNFLGVKKLKFYYPKSHWQQIFWIILHNSSVFPARGTQLLKELIKDGKIEAHLITARYSFLDDHLNNWLRRYGLQHLFKSINLNKSDKQPHLFKDEIISKYKLDYYIEDNLDIVKYLNSKFGTKIYWIYNILDRWHDYPHKFPYLEKALENIIKK